MRAWLQWLFCLTLALAAPARADGWALEALFVSGSAHWSVGRAEPRTLSVGVRLPAGARIETGADGHAYFATADRGFLALRPNTVLRVARYTTDGEPAIQLVLERGVARVVSGRAARARPDRFRMETPVAAIGVRGTDFSVRGSDELTQVTVRSGGVVVSPLGEACPAGGMGPCEGPSAVELFARDAGQLVEVRRGTGQAVRLRQGPDGPEQSAPARPEEKALLGAAPSVGPAQLADVGAGSGVSARATPQPPTVHWGRWAGAAAGSVNDFAVLTDAGRRSIVAADTWYVIAREREPVTLPRDGVVSLALGQAEATVVSPLGATLAPATVTDGTLTLDFGRQQFDTTLRTQGGGYTATLQAAGTIDTDGAFHSHWLMGSNGSVRGAIENQARGAVYLFRQPLNDQAEVAGLASWRRP